MTIEELQRLTEAFRALHNLPAVMIVSFGSERSLFGVAITDGNQMAIQHESPRVLREIANKVEAGLNLIPVEIKRP